MRPNWRTLLSGLVALGLLAGLAPAEPTAEGYRPVAPAPAVHAAVRSSLKTVQDWIGDKDFVSAARDAQGLRALAHLYAYQGNRRDWREQTSALTDASVRLAAAAKREDAAGCAKLTRECERLLDGLAKGVPGDSAPGDRAAVQVFRPQGGVKTWMLLLDSAYSDAKTAKTAKELEYLAYAIAEESNATRYLRYDTRWQEWCADVRTAALDVAEKAKAKDLAPAKTALKVVYQRCEACHRGTRR